MPGLSLDCWSLHASLLAVYRRKMSEECSRISTLTKTLSNEIVYIIVSSCFPRSLAPRETKLDSCVCRFSLICTSAIPPLHDTSMDSFSWSDGLRAALSPCLTCLKSREDSDNEDSQNRNRGPDFVPRARADELEGLLADSDDAETLSLHSNIGQGGKRKKRARRGKTIKLFGFDLFGKPPIHLPEDEDDSLAPPRRTRTISSSTVDSDAAPLDPATIAQLSAARAAESVAQEEADRAAKEERRRRRRERKAQKAALAAALERGEGADFEGFQVNIYSTVKMFMR